jgi:hypothetical protein
MIVDISAVNAEGRVALMRLEVEGDWVALDADYDASSFVPEKLHEISMATDVWMWRYVPPDLSYWYTRDHLKAAWKTLVTQ